MDRWYETAEEEWLDRTDVEPRLQRGVLRGLNRFNRLSGGYLAFQRWVLREVEGLAEPRVLELGAGHGELSVRLLRAHPSLHVTVSDLSPDFVAGLQSGPLGRHPRARVACVDATGSDLPSGAFDVAVMVQTLHHLGPEQVKALLVEGTRVARTLLLVDGWRHPLMMAVAPFTWLLGNYPAFHDGVISLRKMYAPAALHHLAATSGVALRVDAGFRLPAYMVARCSRVTAA